MRLAPVRIVVAFSASAMLAVLTACGSSNTGTNPDTESITLSISPTSATVQQGNSTPITGTVTRAGGFTGPIAITLLNPPAGISGALAAPIAAGSNSGVATLSVASSAAVGVYTLTVQASGSGVATVDAQFTLTVTAAPPAGSFTIGGTPATISAAQGSSGTTGVKATRTNGFTGTIAYVATGAPIGVSVVVAPTATADSSSVTATATTAAAPGAYPITITATSGLLTQVATLTLTVVTVVHVDFSLCEAVSRPIWLAYQDGNGPWTQVTGTADSYSVPAFASGKGAVAYVTQSPGMAVFYFTNVKYILTGDLSAVAPCISHLTGKTINGSVANTGSKAAQIALGGGAAAIATALTPTFQFHNVPSDPRDLLSYLAALSGPSQNDRIIIRRDQNIADGGSVAVLDFNSAEAVAPISATATITGGGPATYIPSLRYLTRASCVADSFTFNSTAFTSPMTIYGVPAALQRSTDFHNFVVEQTNSQLDYRAVTTSFHALTDHTISIGAGVGPVTTSTLPGSYLRLQAAFNLAADYQKATFNYSTEAGANVQTFLVSQSAGYINQAASVTIAAPDLSAVPGWLPVWGPSTTSQHSYAVILTSTPPATLCAEGATERTARASIGLSALRSGH